MKLSGLVLPWWVKPAAGAVLVLGLWIGWKVWLHSHDEAVRTEQRAADQLDIDAANRRGNLAIEANTSLVAVNIALAAAAAADKAERARQDEQGAKELAKAQADAKRAQAEAADWRRRAAPILGTDRCKAAKAQLQVACPVEDF